MILIKSTYSRTSPLPIREYTMFAEAEFRSKGRQQQQLSNHDGFDKRNTRTFRRAHYSGPSMSMKCSGISTFNVQLFQRC
jgi:hypothetical protein